MITQVLTAGVHLQKVDHNLLSAHQKRYVLLYVSPLYTSSYTLILALVCIRLFQVLKKYHDFNSQ